MTHPSELRPQIERVLRVRYPSAEVPHGTLSSLGREFGVSREYVRQIAAGNGFVVRWRTRLPRPSARALAGLSKQQAEQLRRLGERVRLLRRARRLSQGSIARAVGIAQSEVSQYERGRREMSVGIALAIADALDVTLGELVGTDDVIVSRGSRLGEAIEYLKTHPKAVKRLER